MKVRTLIYAILAVTVVATAPIHVNAQEATEVSTKAELVDLGQLLLGFTYMSLGAGNVDTAVAGATEAAHVARLAGDTVLLSRAENHRKAYRGIGLMVTAEAAKTRGHALVAPEITELGCRLLSEVLPGEEWLGPIVEKVRELCRDAATGTSGTNGALRAEKDSMMLDVAAILLANAAALHERNPADAVGNATAALDIMNAVGAPSVAARTEHIVRAYETLSLMKLAETFIEEKVFPLASGKVRGHACALSGVADPSVASILETLRRHCFI